MPTEYTALTRAQRQDIRASQRTFEGAYIRTALAQLTFGTVILRLFRHEFLAVGAVYVASAILFIILAHVQRVISERPLIEAPSTTFRTSGEIVALTSLVSLCAYIALFILTLRLK